MLDDVYFLARYYAYRFEVVVEQHKLCSGKVGLTLHGELVSPVGNLGSLESLHDGVGEEQFFVA
jgi:hypothetical protein